MRENIVADVVRGAVRAARNRDARRCGDDTLRCRRELIATYRRWRSNDVREMSTSVSRVPNRPPKFAQICEIGLVRHRNSTTSD